MLRVDFLDPTRKNGKKIIVHDSIHMVRHCALRLAVSARTAPRQADTRHCL